MEEDFYLLKFVSTVSMVSTVSEFLEYFIVSYSHTHGSGFGVPLSASSLLSFA